MFLNEKFILGNELVQQIGIHIANISMLRSKYVHGDDKYTIIKMNDCTFINTHANKLPRNIKDAVKEHEFTPMYNKLPATYVNTHIQATKRQLTKCGMIEDEVLVAGKRFYVFNDEVVERIGAHVPYILTHDETMSCKENNQIIDYIKMTNNRYFTWY